METMKINRRKFLRVSTIASGALIAGSLLNEKTRMAYGIVTGSNASKNEITVPSSRSQRSSGEPTRLREKREVQVPNLIGELLGRQFRFKSCNYPDHCFRHRNYQLWLDRYEDSGLFNLDSAFTIVPGISGLGISFRSKNYPNLFIRHKNFECFIHKYPKKHSSFKEDASWFPRIGLFKEQGFSFESLNFPGFFMRHKSYRVRIDRQDGSELFTQDASWFADLLENVRTDGEWELVYGNDNEAADWEWSQEIAVGIEITRTSQVSTTDELAWKFGREAGAEYRGMSLKSMFEASGMRSVTRMSSSTWQESHLEKTERKYHGKKGEGFYLWQWNLYATTPDRAVIRVRTNLHDETTEHKLPEYTP